MPTTPDEHQRAVTGPGTHTHTHTHTSTHYRKGPPNSSKKAENISGGKYSKNISGGKNILFQNLHILIPGDHMEGWETAAHGSLENVWICERTRASEHDEVDLI